jgi:N-acetylglucosaminyldiphosphoundecaprenol N-acetyl-beta-D-mannosaminyltransferase
MPEDFVMGESTAMTPLSLNRRLNILNIWVDSVNMEQSLARIKGYLEQSGKPHSIFAVNPEKCFSVPTDPLLKETFRAADMLIPDGVGIVLAARILHGVKLSRVPGVELVEQICEFAARNGNRVFIFGGKEDVNRKAAAILRERYPRLQIAGRCNGYVEEDEMPAVIEKINGSAAEILFLALGSPKQEKWFASHKDRLTTVKVCQGIGGTLDTIAGNVRRAPMIWRKCCAEWLYRLITEPMRIRRQKVLPVFAFRVFASKMKLLLSNG